MSKVCWIGRLLTAAWPVVGLGLLLVASFQVAGQEPDSSGADLGNIFPAAPRELRQNLTRAQAAIADERFSDAADELGRILDSETSDDYFLGRPGQADAQQSLKAEALALIGSMPAKGRQIYETKFGFDAKAELDKALEEGSLARLTEVSRRYFHTKAGYEATLLVGRTLLDQGRPLAAALVLKRIADSPVALGQYDPELTVLLATCWVHARMPEKATEALVALRQRNPQAKVRLLDGEEALFSSDDQSLAWLERIVGGGRTPLSLVATQWVMFRGNESRNATTNGGVPLLNFRWSLPTVNEPADELKVKSIARSMRDAGQPNIVALQPLVVQDTVIYRAPDSNKLLGVDLRTGKRTWVFPPFEDGPLGGTSRPTMPALRLPPGVNLRDQELRQRVWEDHAFGQISSDGRYAYVIDDLGYANTANMAVPRVNVLPGGRGVPNSSWSKPYNLLVALDLAREGYQVWAVGGNEVGNPALTGAFFLGPPLPLGDQLFVLAEVNSEIRLVCLNAATGALEWKQQLAVVEDQQQIIIDRVRRLAGASPSFADGVLICPTSAGAVVAVDLATRSLRWGYQYPRWDLIRSNSGAFGVRTRYAAPGTVSGNWLDSTATISDGAVVLTPVESQELICLDVLTGKLKWPRQQRDDGLFVACVHEGKIIVVGKSKVRAIQLSDGKNAWTKDLALDTDMPVGRGFYTGKCYYLPLSNQQLVKIDLATGEIVMRAKTEIELGNVVCYKDQLLTQSASQVASFFLTEPLLAWIDETLKKEPDNAKALSLKGQVLLQEGKRGESLDLLRRAVAKNPQDLAARSLLVKVMISLLREDFATNFALAEELDTLVTDPVQRRDILRWRAQGLAKAGKVSEALDALLALADHWDTGPIPTYGAEGLESSERDLAVRPDRWLQGQLASLYRAADTAQRARLTTQVQARLDKALHADSASDLRTFVNLFGFHPLADQARLALADKLIAVEQLLEAELLAGELLTSPDQATAAHATATLAAAYEKARRYELSVGYYAVLQSQFADVVCRGGMTGKQLIAKAAAAAVATSPWPSGRVEIAASDGDASSRNLMSAQSRYMVALSHPSGAPLPGLGALFDPNGLQIVVRDDAGRQLTTASLRGADNAYRRLISLSYNMATGKSNGHLVVVNLGDQIVAVDALRGQRSGGDGQLWKLDAVEIDPTTVRSTYPQQRTSANPLTGGRVQLYDPSGRINFYTGPVQSLGICYQRGRQLLCVDPLTGQPLWERGQIPAAAEIFGDDELIFVADPSADEALVLSAIDGSLVGRRKVERAERRWTTHGRRVLAWEQTGTTVTVKLYDAWAQGSPLWSKSFAIGSRGTLVESDELAVLEPGGNFTIVSLADGRVRFASPLEPDRSLGNIHVFRSRQQYVLIASQEAANSESPPGYIINPIGMNLGYQQNRIHGRVHAFDRRTGKAQWQVPAFVAFHGLLPDQPLESPLLFFVRNKVRATPASSSRQSGTVLCLDRRDGRIVWDSEAETESARQITGPINACDVVTDAATGRVMLSVLLQQNVKNFTFQLTDKPTPPEPPAQTGDLSSRSVGEIAGTLDRSIEEAFDLINRGLGPARAIIPGAARGLRLPPDRPMPLGTVPAAPPRPAAP